ncbi:SecB-like chaperone [Dissostichus eleginoides]|uniref:SecB-like chaperone n=1 Tax=Dissostichus eleginoides TaxID=100907 RepID=A0AAD9B601_DISEL|nr:SecB-like chaperone [Dissostichus eleginoides]
MLFGSIQNSGTSAGSWRRRVTPGSRTQGQQEVKCLDSGLLMLFSLLIKSQVTDLIQERLWAAEESTGSSSAQQRDQVTLYSATGGASVPPCSCPGCVYPWPPDR